jgi:hypothetical protein
MRDLTFNEWQVWLRIQLGYSLNAVITYCEALEVDFIKLTELARNESNH